MDVVVLILHVLAALGICGLVLLQHGKGADVGAAFGSGASGSLFGASGSANFLSRATAILAAAFFVTSLGLTYLGGKKTEHKGVMERAKPAEVPVTPADRIPGAPKSAGSAGDVPVPSGGAAKPVEVPK